MKARRIWLGMSGTVILALGLFSGSARAQKNECGILARDLLTSRGGKQSFFLNSSFPNIANHLVCVLQANANDQKIQSAVDPVRTAIWNAFNNLSGSEEQGASSSAGASTNVVSKPSGPSALAEEFGGANVTSGTSSLTVQWAPGSMFTNMALTGADYLCVPGAHRKGCISAGLLQALAPLTLKITANTSSASPATAGTASGASSGGTAPVTVSSNGASGVGFSGLTVQYGFYGSKRKAGVGALTRPTVSTYYVNEMNEGAALWRALKSCSAYHDWRNGAVGAVKLTLTGAPAQKPTAEQLQNTQDAIEKQYQLLLSEMLASKQCATSLQAVQQFMGAILEAETYEEFMAMQNSATPELAVEYDLNISPTEPGYSTVKFTGSWQFGRSVPRGKPAGAAAGAGNCAANTKAAACQVETLGESQSAAVTARLKGDASTAGTTAAARSLADAAAQPWALTVNAGAALYNSEPPSSVPSASRLRDVQFAAEMSYLFAPSSDSGAMRKFLGPMTAAVAYSYQDQTSPAILSGPGLTDFTGLASSTTSAYTKRGPIHLGQVRFGFGKGANTTFPLAFTYSNRTELIVHPTWGVQFGVGYNLTSLFAAKSSGT